MLLLSKIGSLIILPFALIYLTFTSSISNDVNSLSGNTIVNSREEAQKITNDLIKKGADVSMCNKLKANETFGFSSGDVLFICINSFAKSKKDVSICKIHENKDTSDLCINSIAVENNDPELCLEISSTDFKDRCQKYILEKDMGN